MAIRTGVDWRSVTGDPLNQGDYREQPAEEASSEIADNIGDSETGCTVKQLPRRLQFRSAEVATIINPVNAPGIGPTALAGTAPPDGPLRAAISTAKYWGPTRRTLTVSFLDGGSQDLRRRILSHLNAWSRTGCIDFAETQGTGQVRIARGGGGYWSYLGTDVLLIPHNRPTMNLQGFTTRTPESEYKRVVRHEAGHTLGMPHEHMRRALVERIDREKAYNYFFLTQRWDRDTVDQQVLTPLEEATLMATPADQDSIMCYRLPGSITIDGLPIRGGVDINDSDYAFIGRVYPRQDSAPGDPADDNECWPESEDVRQLLF